uniref:Uncharacterized protein n=1 Tax=Moniliophthora roreri TaxID=221103 RepID=A0A0W0FNE4_MONRR
MSNTFPFESLYSIQGVLLGLFVSVSLMLFLLGFYVLLFGLVVYFLCVRQTSAKRRLHLWWTTMLFVLSFSSAVLNAAEQINTAVLGFQAATTQDFDALINWVTVNSDANKALEIVPTILYLLANCIADMILVYRCFVLWESMRHIFIVAIVVLFSTNAIGFAGFVMAFLDFITEIPEALSQKATVMSTGYFIANAINTFLLTLTIGTENSSLALDLQ